MHDFADFKAEEIEEEVKRSKVQDETVLRLIFVQNIQ